MRKFFVLATIAIMMLSITALANAPIQGNVSVQVNKPPEARHIQQPERKGLLDGLISLFDSSGRLETDQVATSVARYFLTQGVPISTILIMAPETENKVTEQFQAYLSATLLHAGYPMGQPTAADLPQSRFVPFAVYPYGDGVIIKLVVGKTQMTRYYALAPSGAIRSASAFLITQAEGEK